ncbi:MAG: hypothetical protein AAF846_15870 [Chloroflexota bacterium]
MVDEKNNGTEKHFIETWDQVEAYFLSLSWCEQMRELIAQLRLMGYDKVTRADTSMSTLHLSRSITWREARNNPQICFAVISGKLVVTYYGRGTSSRSYKVSFDTIKINHEIKMLLRKIVAKPILE